jgi:hypothetical protein
MTSKLKDNNTLNENYCLLSRIFPVAGVPINYGQAAWTSNVN